MNKMNQENETKFLSKNCNIIYSLQAVYLEPTGTFRNMEIEAKVGRIETVVPDGNEQMINF